MLICVLLKVRERGKYRPFTTRQLLTMLKSFGYCLTQVFFFKSQDVLLSYRDEVGINDLILYIDHRLASVLCFLRNILITISNYYKSNYAIWYMYVLFRTNKIFNMFIQIVMFYVWIFCLAEIFQIGFHLPIRNLVSGI